MDRLLRLLVLGLLLALAGCTIPSRPAGGLFPRPGVATQVATPAGTAATAGQAGPATATASAAPSSTATPSAPPRAATVTPAPTSPPAAAADAIKAVIQRANDEQQRAFAAHDPTLMRDTATGDYYDQLVQTNRDLENGGVTAIRLVALEWGQITLQGATDAQATTIETWRTTFSDGSTAQGRDRNVYTLVQEGGAWKIQADEHPDDQLEQPAPGASGAAPTAPTAPTTPRPAAPSGSGQSRNWSGYAATGGTFTAVAGTWTVPQVSAASGRGAGDATWVGIGGVNTRDLIQAGTDASVAGGQVRYTAWLEMLPQASRPVPLAVGPGDTVSVSIAEQPDGSWLIAFRNRTTGRTYQATETYTSSHSSAEWVEEAPSAGRRTIALDDFGTVQFAEASAVENGQQRTIAQAGGRAITMIDSGGQPLAEPSALGGDGTGFSVRRTGVPSTAPAPGGDLPGSRLPG